MRLPILTILAMAVGGCASAPTFDVPFAAVRPQFARGDSIVIDEVRGAFSSIKAGDRVIVRGSYTLVSCPEAKLMLGLYTGSRANPTNDVDSLEASIAALKDEKIAQFPGHRTTETQAQSVTKVSAGSGKFELSLRAKAAGELAALFVAPAGGRPFGKVFFAVVAEK